MNSGICSTSVTAVPADDGPLAGTTVDPWMPQQDQLNSGDVVLSSAGSGKLKDSRREPRGTVSVAVPFGARVRGEPAKAA
jgi:hypothetical protein